MVRGASGSALSLSVIDCTPQKPGLNSYFSVSLPVSASLCLFHSLLPLMRELGQSPASNSNDVVSVCSHSMRLDDGRKLGIHPAVSFYFNLQSGRETHSGSDLRSSCVKRNQLNNILSDWRVSADINGESEWVLNRFIRSLQRDDMLINHKKNHTHCFQMSSLTCPGHLTPTSTCSPVSHPPITLSALKVTVIRQITVKMRRKRCEHPQPWTTTFCKQCKKDIDWYWLMKRILMTRYCCSLWYIFTKSFRAERSQESPTLLQELTC